MVLTIFFLGAISASFIGVVVARLYTSEGFLAGRSRCDACNAPLHPLVLIPVISYIISNGHARCCGARLSVWSPLTELLLGGLFALSYVRLGLSNVLLLLLTALSLLFFLVLYDLKHQILPPLPLALFVVASTATGFFSAPSLGAFSESLFTAFGIALSLALIHLFSRGRAMGLADAPLVFGLSLLTGPSAFFGFIFSFWIGAVVGIVILFKRPRGSRMGIEVPFAPFLAAGFLLAFFTQWNPLAFIAALL